jgi:hypothetical protein
MTPRDHAAVDRKVPVRRIHDAFVTSQANVWQRAVCCRRGRVRGVNDQRGDTEYIAMATDLPGGDP